MSNLHKYSLVVTALVATLGCNRVPAPDAGARTTGYDLLAESARVPVGVVLLSLVDDAVALKLDQVEVGGLDNAIKAWQEVGRGAGITTVRHQILGSTHEGITIMDSGLVTFTFMPAGSKVARDSVLAFRGIWNKQKQGWRMGYEAITPLPAPTPAAR